MLSPGAAQPRAGGFPQGRGCLAVRLKRRPAYWFLAIASILMYVPGAAHAQTSLDPEPTKSPLPNLTRPSKSPGSLETGDFSAEGVSVVAGRKRGGVIPRRSTSTPTAVSAPSLDTLQHKRVGKVKALDLEGLALSASENIGEPVNPSGVTLDDAIAQMVAQNIELHAFSKEIPQAEADLLTAGLRTCLLYTSPSPRDRG